MIIPEATIQKIKDEADIVKVIGDYIKLEKKGGNFMGVCPFHPDSNPSLTVSPSKKIYKCFSCGASGNVLTFVQNYEKVTFLKAVQIAGEKCGIKVEIDSSTDSSQNLEKYYKIIEKATNFYEFFLKNTEEGKEALNYLYKRKLSDEIIKRFQIGLAPKEADLLYKSLLNDKFQPLDMIEAGVVRSSTNYYDVFRNRVMFPIEDINGNYVGFSGRIYQSESKEAKYLNSNENVIFKKGNILYNYNQALNDIRMKDQVFLFEGFMDVIASYRAKVYNAIASMGTSLTLNQIKAISKTTNNVVICYDGDNPGIEATKKAIQLFTKANFNVKTVLLPDELDPDEYINLYGEEKLYDYLNNQAISGIDYLYEAEKKKLDASDINSVERFKNAIFGHLNNYDSNVIRERFLQKLSEDIKISISSLKDDYQKKSDIILEDSHISPIIDFQPIKPEIKKKHYKSKYIKAERQLIKQLYNEKKVSLEVENMLRAKYVDRIDRDILFKLYDYYRMNDIMIDDKFHNLLDKNELEVLLNILNSNSFNDYIEINILVDTIKKYQDEKIAEELAKSFNENKDDSCLVQYAQVRRKSISMKSNKTIKE